MLAVPTIRQPNATTCLPACIWSVLTYHGYEVDLDDLIDLCEVGRFGACQEVALQALSDAEWDVEVLSKWDRRLVSEALADDRPVIMSLLLGQVGPHPLAHAVVVCGLDDQSITVMDPLQSDYATLDLATVEMFLGDGIIGAFILAGSLPAT